MQPDDLSMPRGDNKIKEKLNLHLKKRLQETGKNSTASENPPPASSSSSSCSTAVARTASGPSAGSKTKKQKTKHSPSSAASVSATISSNSSLNLSGGSSGSKPSANVSGEHLMLSPGALGGGNSNDTTNSSFNSVDLDPDNSNDGQDRAAEKNSPGGTSRVAPKADIFTLILNEKKNSLMRDPEVVKFLRDLIDAREKS
ncbi:dentin sialophosphoprotein-like [Armigeres subalbatus]|uniref:dentin sialophosphoprotein-like n=1 Tax=Armigeres subalbatus TaxID=124917 RepID=UPI002ED46E5C